MNGLPSVIEVDYVPDTAPRLHLLAHQPWFVFLDSCHRSEGGGRYDIAAWLPRTTLLTRGQQTQIVSGGRARVSRADPFTLAREHLEPRTAAAPLPFSGGAIGFFSYDLARRIEHVPSQAATDLALPDMALGIYDRVLVVDHGSSRAWFVHAGLRRGVLKTCLAQLEPPRTVTPPVLAPRFSVTSVVGSDTSLTEYAAAFRRIKRYIRDGDCYQVNYAQRFSARAQGDPWEAYLRLRNLNPAPHAAFLKIPGAAVLSSSPERFLKVNAGEVETKPIKGTRARSLNVMRDRELARALAASEKDRAENLMIVDLLRNDIGKVCVPGSVDVPDLFAIESFARVHHMVSTVRGRLRSGVHALDVLRACFPGGSITGAPKLRAMEIVEELEPTRRGIYCGSIGYITHGGDMDMNIAIRTLVYLGGRLYCWAGGGIVMDSELDGEYQESLDKASAMLNLFSDAQIQNVGR